MQTWIYLTYAPDRDKLWESVRSVRRHYPTDRIAVLMEAGKEFDEGFQFDLKEQFGCEVETTYWKRGGNLNGCQNAHGMWRTFARYAEDSERIFKIDSDVILLQPPPDGNFMLVWDSRKPERVIFGMLYGLTSDTVKRLWDQWGQRAYEFMRMPKRRFAEDLFMRYMVESGKEPHTRVLYEKQEINIWKYRHELAPVHLKGSLVINFGFYKHCEDRAVHAEMMKKANELIKTKP